MKKKPYDPDAWKSKIDPDLDIVVKALLRQIREIKAYTDEGNFEFNEEMLKAINDGEGIQPSYDGKEFQDAVTEITELAKGEIDTSGNQTIDARNEKIEASRKQLMSLTENLSEASRKYYYDKIDALFNCTLLKPFNYQSEKERVKIIKYNSRELGSVVIPLFCHNFIKTEDEWSENEEILKDPSSLSFILGQIFSMFSQIAYQTSIEELLKKGDDRSLLRAVIIDKGLLNHETLKRRISRARLSRDTKFLKQLGHAISKKPLSKEAQHYETYIVLRLFWLAGLYKLYDVELYQFLKSCDIIPPEYPHALKQFVKRHILPLYRNQ